MQSALKEELAALELSLTNQLKAAETHTEQGLSSATSQIDQLRATLEARSNSPKKVD